MRIEDTEFYKTLTTAGFKYERNTKSNSGYPNDIWIHRFSNNDLDFYMDCCIENLDSLKLWHSRHANGSESMFYGKSSRFIISYFKEQVITQTQEITKENLMEVLKLNKLITVSVKVSKKGDLIGFDCNGVYCDFDNKNWLTILESALDKKLEQLPKINLIHPVKAGQLIRYTDEYTRFYTTNKWYEISSVGAEMILVMDNSGYKHKWDNLTKFSNSFDLTDIRDYNPDKPYELRIGDSIEFNFGSFYISEFDFEENKIRYKDDTVCTLFDSINDNHIDSVNGKKYKQLKVPQFDFIQYLLDNGVKSKAHSGTTIHLEKSISGKYILNNGKHIKPTLHNAKLIIAMNKLVEELE